MPRGGKREGAGRKAGFPSTKTVARQAIADKASAEGKMPLEVMLENMRHFQQVALDAEATIAGLTAGEIAGGVELNLQDQFKLLLARVTEAAGLRKLAQDCAKEAAPYLHPRLATVEPRQGDKDFVPLRDRLQAYGREDAINGSAGKVVAIEKRQAKG